MNNSKLWEIDDGESYYIMAPTWEEAAKYWLANCADGYRVLDYNEVDVSNITNKAHLLSIRSDDDMGGPPRSAKQWMDQEPLSVCLIGSSVW